MGLLTPFLLQVTGKITREVLFVYFAGKSDLTNLEARIEIILLLSICAVRRGNEEG